MLKYLLEKEIRQMLRDPMTFIIVLIIPALFILILPQGTTFEVRRINCSVVDLDHSRTSARLIQKICSSGHFSLKAMDNSYKQALSRVDRGEVNLILQIPYGLEKSTTDGTPIDFMVGVNSINGNQGIISLSYMSNILYGFISEVCGNTETVNIEHADIQPKVLGLFNKYLDYKYLMIPGLLCSLLMLASSLPSLNIAMEKENGTITQIKMSPAGISRYLLSKMITNWALALTMLIMSMFWAWVFYGMIPKGNFALILVGALIFLISASGIQLILLGCSHNIQQTMILSVFVCMIITLFNGIYTPIQNMPEWGKTFCMINPLSHLVKISRAVYLKSSSFIELYKSFMALSLLAVLYNTIGFYFHFRKK